MKIKYLATLISAAIALSCYGSSSEPVSLPRPEYPDLNLKERIGLI